MPQTISYTATLNQFVRSMPRYLQALLPRAAVLSAVAWALPDLNEQTAKAVERDWQLSTGEINRLRLGQVPTEIQNIMIANEIAQMFSHELLTPECGFYCFKRPADLCDYCLSECECADLPTWRIDLDPELSRTGIVLPIREPKFKWIVDLKTFRSTKDTNPFSLRVCRKEAA